MFCFVLEIFCMLILYFRMFHGEFKTSLREYPKPLFSKLKAINFTHGLYIIKWFYANYMIPVGVQIHFPKTTELEIYAHGSWGRYNQQKHTRTETCWTRDEFFLSILWYNCDRIWMVYLLVQRVHIWQNLLLGSRGMLPNDHFLTGVVNVWLSIQCNCVHSYMCCKSSS